MVLTWEDIARDQGRFIYTVAYRLTGNHSDAEDLVQEVLVRVERGLATYEPRSLTGWLSRITTNAFYDEARRRQRRPTTELPEDTERIPGVAPTPDEAAAAEGLPEYLQQALLELPIDYRSAVVLCDIVGLSYSEIGDILDLPVGTVRSRIHRGRSRLRAHLEASGTEL